MKKGPLLNARIKEYPESASKIRLCQIVIWPRNGKTLIDLVLDLLRQGSFFKDTAKAIPTALEAEKEAWRWKIWKGKATQNNEEGRRHRSTEEGMPADDEVKRQQRHRHHEDVREEHEQQVESSNSEAGAFANDEGASRAAPMFSTTKGRKKVLVTGGAGFIGSHVADHLLTRGVLIVDEFNDYYDTSLKRANVDYLLAKHGTERLRVIKVCSSLLNWQVARHTSTCLLLP